jgi:hypothetical protein
VPDIVYFVTRGGLTEFLDVRSVVIIKQNPQMIFGAEVGQMTKSVGAPSGSHVTKFCMVAPNIFVG